MKETLSKPTCSGYESEEFKRGTEYMWEIARRVCGSITNGGMSDVEVAEIFECNHYDVLAEYTAQQVIEKYEAYKSKLEELSVGDEVTCDTENSGKVISIVNGCVYVMWEDGTVYAYHIWELNKTGKHDSKIEEVFKRSTNETD